MSKGVMFLLTTQLFKWQCQPFYMSVAPPLLQPEISQHLFGGLKCNFVHILMNTIG